MNDCVTQMASVPYNNAGNTANFHRALAANLLSVDEHALALGQAFLKGMFFQLICVF